jgi:hypothetical protein
VKKVFIKSLLMDRVNNSPVVSLGIEGSSRVIYIWIGACEAWALAMALEGLFFERPLTHDLLIKGLELSDSLPERVIISSISGGTFFAKLILKKFLSHRTDDSSEDFSFIEVDARPSDCIVIAAKTKIPIYVTSEVILEVSVEGEGKIDAPKEEEEKKEFHKFLESFSIDELKKYLEGKNDRSEGST